jgi:hypothetical protein
VSVRIETEDLCAAVDRRPFAYVASAGGDGVAHLRAIVCDPYGSGFRFRVGQRTATNVRETGHVTLVWPPLSGQDVITDYDDHSVIADCAASIDPEVDDDGDMYLIVVPTSAVWHRPARR